MDKNDQNNRLTKIKSAWHKLVLTSTFHGVPKIASADRTIVKLVWLLLIVLSFTGGLINIVQTTNDYYKHDVITNVDRIYPNSVTFPAITVCTKDYFSLKHRNLSVIDYFLIQNVPFNEFVKGATFKGRDVHIEYFKIPKSFGDCVRFNGLTQNGTFETVEFKADSFDLQIVRSLHQFISTDEYFNRDLVSTMEAYVTDNFLNSYEHLDPFVLFQNKEQRVTIVKAETEKKLGHPFNDCSDTNDPAYRQMNCIEKCINEEIRNEYNCSIPSYYRINGLEECVESDQLNDMQVSHKDAEFDSYEKHIAYIRNLTNEFYPRCEEKCPKECESVLIHTNVLTTPGTINSFSVSDFSTLTITQIPKMNLFYYISNIGGSLGLFVGISFLSFAELLEFFIEVFLIICFC